MTPCRYSGTISIAPNNASCTIHVKMMLRVKSDDLNAFSSSSGCFCASSTKMKRMSAMPPMVKPVIVEALDQLVPTSLTPYASMEKAIGAGTCR